MAELIGNRTLRELVVEHIKSVATNRNFITEHSLSPFQIPSTKASGSQQNRFESDIVAWAIEPSNPTYENMGLGFKLMLTQILKMIYKEKDGFLVVPSPAPLRFLGNKIYGQYGPAADIIIGKQTGEGIVQALCLVTGAVGEKKMGRRMNKALLVPVVSLPGDELFGNGRLAVREFATSDDPMEIVQGLAQRAHPMITGRLNISR